MAIKKKFDPNQTYFSKKLEDRLKTIYEYPVTIVEAPTGYGKTTAVREYIKENGFPCHWFNIDTDNKEKVYNDFCEKIKTINETAARKLLSIGIPFDEKTCNQMVETINGISYIEPTMFVVDNYHLVADKYIDEVIKDLAGSANKNVRIVIITQAINSNGAFEMILSRKINHISKADFELSKSDIIQYYKDCGIKLEDNEADFLYKYTEGWISALYLQMLSFNATNTFEMTVDIENLIGKAYWYNLDRISQELLVGISVFNSFTIRQCQYIANGMVNIKDIEKLLNDSGFVRYDAKEGRYFMHSILKYFLENEFEKMDVVFRKEILKKAGDWYKDNEDYAEAIHFYYRIKDFEALLSMSYGADVIYKLQKQKNNRDMLLDITTNVPAALKKKYLKTYMLFVFFLFLDNQREYYSRECDNVYKLLESSYKEHDEYDELLGEYYVLESYNNHNDLQAMKENLEKAYNLLRKPSRILAANMSMLFKNPSPVSLYHSNPGKIFEEAEKLDNLMPVFYRITDGKSKGLEALFRAEMLFYKGELKDAQKLCEKTIYMSSSREQVDIQMSAYLCMSRISYLRGDTENLKLYMDEMENLSVNNSKENTLILKDLCVGLVHVTVSAQDKIAAWLTDAKSIEKNTSVTSLTFANIVYGKYLLSKGEYNKFLSISGQMLGVAGIYNSIVSKIYTLIYMSVAKFQTNDTKKATDLLKEAIELAKADDMYIPFVENYTMLTPVIGLLENNFETEFIQNFGEFAKKFVRGIQSIERLNGDDKRFGLTKREMEVAKLAAQRYSNKEIAEQLFIAESTVKSNLKVIFHKLGVKSRNELKELI